MQGLRVALSKWPACMGFPLAPREWNLKEAVEACAMFWSFKVEWCTMSKISGMIAKP
jgi:hypothetical protein